MKKKEPLSLQTLLDPAHQSFRVFNDKQAEDVWKQRYAALGEYTIEDTFVRVATAINKRDGDFHVKEAQWAMASGVFMPAGRILASAGLTTNATLQNCYVSRVIEDSMEGIHEAFAEAMQTLGKFGGIGMDFSPIRPKGAKVGNQGLTSPGIIPWMEMFHEGAQRIMQAGHRRGAMMGVLRCDHPDICDFITAKTEAGALTNFNISVLVTDKFMEAVENDETWELVHDKPRTGDADAKLKNAEGKYVYKRIAARELWDMLLTNTYMYAEPGVIFIDKINAQNNLYYCEQITCTNPCGEQPLPPYGACNLGHINLGRCVLKPFTEGTEVNYDLLKEAIRIAVRFLDNVIDESKFPLNKQREEQLAKRRIGLGISGLHDMLLQLCIPYDSSDAQNLTADVMAFLAHTTYGESVKLAKEKYAFPMHHSHTYARHGFAQNMLLHRNKTYIEHGIRNSLLLTVAPTGTVSVVYGNISSGIEPVFAWRTKRKVHISNTETEEHTSESFISRFWHHCNSITKGDLALQKYAKTALQLDVDAHVAMQGIVQRWIDASVSKTINVPKEMPFSQFKSVYQDAYDMGCKGCTTYRPSEVRGVVLEDADALNIEPGMSFGTDHVIDTVTKHADHTEVTFNVKDTSKFNWDTSIEAVKLEPQPITVDGTITKPTPQKRPPVLAGCTYKIKWPSQEDNIYLTINELDGRPYEIFIASRDLRNIEWLVLTCMLSSQSLRRGENPMDVAKLFMGIQGAHDAQWIGKRNYTSLPQYIGELLESHFKKYEEDPVGHKMSDAGAGSGEPEKAGPQESYMIIEELASGFGGIKCPKCAGLNMYRQEGCDKCLDCGYSKCG